jgi:hypothetical protein
MALLFIDGFDAADTSTKWDVNGSATVSATTRFGVGRSIGIGSGGTRYVTKYFTASSEIYMGFAASGLATGFNTIPFLYLFTDAGLTAQINLVSNSNGSVAIRRGGTQIATTGAGLLFPSWYYMEIYAKIDATVGVVTLKINGNTEATFSGNTKSGGTSNNIDGLQLTNNGTIGSGLIDDLYILDSNGPAPYNTFLGDVRVYTMSPSAAGNSTGFTPSSGANYTTVDELPYSATDYVAGTSPTTRDTYQMGDLPAGINTIFGVQTNVIAKKTDAGNISLKPVVRSGTTNYYGTTYGLTSNDKTYYDLRSTDPNTSSAWTASGVNNMESGMEIA